MFWLCCWAQSAKDNVKYYLKEYINHAKQVSGQPQVDIIAHSMGGIVSRTYIQSDEYKAENDVRKFAMVGTPNQGAPLPYFIYEGGDVLSADIVTGADHINKPNRYFYTHSLNKFYQSLNGGRSACENIPIVGEKAFNATIPGIITNLLGNFREPWCDRNEVYQFVRGDVPGLKELLFTYDDAVIDSETGESIDYPVNQTLINLNKNYDILKEDVETMLFVGIEDPNTTLETIITTSSHNDFLYLNYGYPQYEYPIRSRGDGTVPEVSIELEDLPVYKEYDESHGALPNAAADDLVTFITRNEQN